MPSSRASRTSHTSEHRRASSSTTSGGHADTPTPSRISGKPISGRARRGTPASPPTSVPACCLCCCCHCCRCCCCHCCWCVCVCVCVQVRPRAVSVAVRAGVHGDRPAVRPHPDEEVDGAVVAAGRARRVWSPRVHHPAGRALVGAARHLLGTPPLRAAAELPNRPRRPLHEPAGEKGRGRRRRRHDGGGAGAAHGGPMLLPSRCRHRSVCLRLLRLLCRCGCRPCGCTRASSIGSSTSTARTTS